MAIRRNRRKYIGAVIMAMCSATTGLVLGWLATVTPTVTAGGPRDRIEVWSDVEAAPVTFIWVMAPDGSVTIGVGLTLSPHDDLPDPPEADSLFGAPVDVTLLLFCEARLVPANELPIVATGGSEDGCAVDESEPAWQRIDIPVSLSQSSPPLSDVSTLGTWTSSAAGVRVARAPQVTMGNPSGFHITDIDRTLQVPWSESSSVGTAMRWSEGESLTSFQPPEAVDDSYSVAVQVESPWSERGASIDWLIENGGYQIPTTEVRWSDASGTAVAQAQLLVAGVLLGVAASVLVESVLEWLRETHE